MSTTQQDKPAAKPRQRSRKADQNQKGEQPAASAKPDQVNQDQVAPLVASIEVPMTNGAGDTDLSGDVLPPKIRLSGTALPSSTIGIQSIAQAYADYTRKSWQAGRLLVDRFMTARSLDEAIEIQGDFAKQACANLIAHSQEICGLYGELPRQFFRPMENLATQWTRIGR